MSVSSSPDNGSDFDSAPNPWGPQTQHANGHTPEANGSSTPSVTHSSMSHDSTSPSAISLRAFLLGVTLGTSLILTIHLALLPSPLWRLPFFVCALSTFHYLEYQTTAIYNPAAATVAAFLLSSNGRAYNIAHTLAFTECGIRWYFYPNVHMASTTLQDIYLVLGFAMMLVGQVTRTTAMAHAGTSFNHVVQSKKKEGHVLVTDGVYRWLRHPSYFGFFWWGLGSQVVLGNGVCFLGYAVVLWRFFKNRIRSE